MKKKKLTARLPAATTSPFRVAPLSLLPWLLLLPLAGRPISTQAKHSEEAAKLLHNEFLGEGHFLSASPNKGVDQASWLPDNKGIDLLDLESDWNADWAPRGSETYERLVLEGSTVSISCPHLVSSSSSFGAAAAETTTTMSPVEQFNHRPGHQEADSLEIIRLETSKQRASEELASGWFRVPGRAQSGGPPSAGDAAGSSKVRWFRNHVPLQLNSANHSSWRPSESTAGGGAAAGVSREAASSVELNQPLSFAPLEGTRRFTSSLANAETDSLTSKNVNEQLAPEEALARRIYINQFGELVINGVSRYFAGKFTCLVAGKTSDLILDVIHTEPDDAADNYQRASKLSLIATSSLARLGQNYDISSAGDVWDFSLKNNSQQVPGSSLAAPVDRSAGNDQFNAVATWQAQQEVGETTLSSINLLSHPPAGSASFIGRQGELEHEHENPPTEPDPARDNSQVDNNSSIELNSIKSGQGSPAILTTTTTTSSELAKEVSLFRRKQKGTHVNLSSNWPNEFRRKTISLDKTKKSVSFTSKQRPNGGRNISMKLRYAHRLPVHMLKAETILASELRLVSGFFYTSHKLYCPINKSSLESLYPELVVPIIRALCSQQQQAGGNGTTKSHQQHTCFQLAKRLILRLFYANRILSRQPMLGISWFKDGVELNLEGEEEEEGERKVGSHAGSGEARSNVKLADQFNIIDRKERDNNFSSSSTVKGAQPSESEEWGRKRRRTGTRESNISSQIDLSGDKWTRLALQGATLQIEAVRRDNAGHYTCALNLSLNKLARMLEQLRAQASREDRLGRPIKWTLPADRAASINDKSLCDEQPVSSEYTVAGIECRLATSAGRHHPGRQPKITHLAPARGRTQIEMDQRNTIEFVGNTTQRSGASADGDTRTGSGTVHRADGDLALRNSTNILESILAERLAGELALNYIAEALSQLEEDPLAIIQSFSVIVAERVANSSNLWATIVEAENAYSRRKLAEFRRLKRSSAAAHRLAEFVEKSVAVGPTRKVGRLASTSGPRPNNEPNRPTMSRTSTKQHNDIDNAYRILAGSGPAGIMSASSPFKLPGGEPIERRQGNNLLPNSFDGRHRLADKMGAFTRPEVASDGLLSAVSEAKTKPASLIYSAKQTSASLSSNYVNERRHFRRATANSRAGTVGPAVEYNSNDNNDERYDDHDDDDDLAEESSNLGGATLIDLRPARENHKQETKDSIREAPSGNPEKVNKVWQQAGEDNLGIHYQLNGPLGSRAARGVIDDLQNTRKAASIINAAETRHVSSYDWPLAPAAYEARANRKLPKLSRLKSMSYDWAPGKDLKSRLRRSTGTMHGEDDLSEGDKSGAFDSQGPTNRPFKSPESESNSLEETEKSKEETQLEPESPDGRQVVASELGGPGAPALNQPPNGTNYDLGPSKSLQLQQLNSNLISKRPSGDDLIAYNKAVDEAPTAAKGLPDNGLDESLMWMASQYLYMHMKASASSSLFTVEVDVEWSNERANNGSDLNPPLPAARSKQPGGSSFRTLPSPPLNANGAVPFATIDVISGQNLRLECTAQALGRLPKVEWYKRINELPGKSRNHLELARRIGHELYWPLTKLELLFEERADNEQSRRFVCSESTTIFDNLANQTFTVVNSLQLSRYNDVILFGDDEAPSSVKDNPTRRAQSGSLVGQTSNANLYACIVDADVRHNYATLAVHFRQPPNPLIAAEIRKRLLARSAAAAASAKGSQQHSIRTRASEVSQLRGAGSGGDELALALNAPSRPFPTGYDSFQDKQLHFPLKAAYWVPIQVGNLSRTGGEMSLHATLAPMILTGIILFVFSSLLALIYLTLHSYKALKQIQLEEADEELVTLPKSLSKHFGQNCTCHLETKSRSYLYATIDKLMVVNYNQEQEQEEGSNRVQLGGLDEPLEETEVFSRELYKAQLHSPASGAESHQFVCFDEQSPSKDLCCAPEVSQSERYKLAAYCLPQDPVRILENPLDQEAGNQECLPARITTTTKISGFPYSKESHV